MNSLTYLAFTSDHPVDQAIEAFRKRFNRLPKVAQPDSVLTGLILLRVGPVEEEETNQEENQK